MRSHPEKSRGDAETRRKSRKDAETRRKSRKDAEARRKKIRWRRENWGF